MAMFHFRLKSDKKPSGSKVSPVKHVEYINREGSFAHDERWQQSNKFSDNFIPTAQTSNALDGINALLYKTDEFGSIKNTERGLEVTDNASLTTISIALMLSDEIMGHNPLIINGSPDFQRAVLEVSVQFNLPISFHDPLLQREFELQKADKDNAKKNSLQAAEPLSPNAQILSPLLHRLKQSQSKMQPKTDFACQHCPNGLWFIQNQT